MTTSYHKDHITYSEPISKMFSTHYIECNCWKSKPHVQCESKKTPLYSFLKFFSQTVGNF